MIRNIVLGGLAVATAMGQPVCAAPMTYSCDTPADRYSDIQVPVDLSAFKMSGTITADMFRKGKYWPVANVSLTDKEGNSIWLRLVANKDQTAANITVETSKAKKLLGRKIGDLPLGQPLNFSIDSSTLGKVMITANEFNLEVNSEVASEATLSISCSTGEFNFSNLEWSDK